MLATLCNNGKCTDIVKMVPAAVEALGGLDALVNNAGISGPTAPVEEMDPDKWGEMMKVDLIGTFNVTRVAIPHLKKSSAGSIITMSSLGGRFGYPNCSPYNVAKAGLIGFNQMKRESQRRFFLAAGSAALIAVSSSGNMEGQIDAGEDEPLGTHSQWQSGCCNWSGTRDWSRSSSGLCA